VTSNRETNRTLALIDGDILVYRASLKAQEVVSFDDGCYITQADINVAYHSFTAQLEDILEEVEATLGATAPLDFRIALSSPTYFRKAIYPEYKGHRAGSEGPIVRKDLHQWVKDTYPQAIEYDDLEGDDVLGIMLTKKHKIHYEKIICVSIDKDLLTVPGLHYNPDKPEQGILEQGLEVANEFHLFQTLTGDSTDGYPGCPGVGPAGALKVLEDPCKSVRVVNEFKRGARKGETEFRWTKSSVPCSQWEAIVYEYLKKGLTEEDALVQARLARILRAEDFDFNTGKPILWTPESKGVVKV
jgi:DNA polymerase-1